MENNEINKIDFDKEKYNFVTDTEDVFKTKIGLDEEVVKNISKYKEEPLWMTEFRLKGYHQFKKMPDPSYGPSLETLDYDNITFYKKVSGDLTNDWDDVPLDIKQTFDKLGIQESEQKFLSGVSTQMESEVVYENMKRELTSDGVIFTTTDEALKKYPEIFKKYFASIVPISDNKFSALNSAVWSGGSFIYVPKGVVVKKPIQSYFRINSEEMGQFERTLIIVDDDAKLSYVEGCTAPKFSKNSLHSGVVEIYVGKNASCRYTTIQNWSTNIINLVTQRARVMDGGLMEWVDGNIGGGINMIYPSCILQGQGAKGSSISIAVAGKGQYQDAGAKMIHLAPDTQSTIISKSIANNGGKVNYRGKCFHSKNAKNAKSFIQCDTIIMDDISSSDTIPLNISENSSSSINHEATVSKVDDEQIFYLMSRGLTEQEATEMIVMGFLEPFAKELPMEYAVELNQLIKLEMSGSIG